MINSVLIGNFKAFDKPQYIPIKPITLIYGPNSAGKSSVVQSLIFANEAERTGKLDLHTTDIGGSAIDLGGFRQFVHRRDAQRRLTWGCEIAAASASQFNGYLSPYLSVVQTLKVELSIGISLGDEGQPSRASEPVLIRYELWGDDDRILYMNRDRDGDLRLAHINLRHQLILNFLEDNEFETWDVDDHQIEHFGDLVLGLVAGMSRLFPEGMKFKKSLDRNEIKSSEGSKHAPEYASRFIMFLNDLVASSSSAIKSDFDSLVYLGPLRSLPARHLVFADHADANWYAGGGFAWDVVRLNATVRSKVNEWLGSSVLKTPYELMINHSINVEKLRELLIGFDESLMRENDEVEINEVDIVFDSLMSNEKFLAFLRNEGIEPIVNLELIDKKSDTAVSHRDVGIGISQVLPVLVMAFASQNKLIAMEQPEIHLHPALQAELGDVFIDSAISEQANRFLIETHSEHLLLRIMRRMRETYEGNLPDDKSAVTPEEVAVLYVEPVATGGSIVREMPLNEQGELVKAWPGGFFEESLREIF